MYYDSWNGTAVLSILRMHYSFTSHSRSLRTHGRTANSEKRTRTQRARQSDRVALQLSPSVPLKPRSCIYIYIYRVLCSPNNHQTVLASNTYLEVVLRSTLYDKIAISVIKRQFKQIKWNKYVYIYISFISSFI